MNFRLILIEYHRTTALEFGFLGASDDWVFVLMVGSDSDCTLPFDKIYGVMGLLAVDLRVDPDYTVSSRHILSNIVQKQMAFKAPGLFNIWVCLSRLFKIWNDLGDGIESIDLIGLIHDPDRHLYTIGDSTDRIERMEHNLRLYLQELEIPIPANMEAAAPSRIRLRTQSSVDQILYSTEMAR